MHVLTLFVEGIATPFSLHYRGAEEANEALHRVLNAKWEDELAFMDDFGQSLTVFRAAIKVPVLIDVARGLEAQLAMMELQSKAGRKAGGGSTLMVPANTTGWGRQ